jgi:hypothetical protein
LFVVSGDAADSVVPHDPDGSGHPAPRRLITAEVAGHQYQGWIHVPTEAA